jgi:transcriptional pleiotropic regulator of transition state genes
MKSTGIIRKIDELGRIVVPKEMRSKLQLDTGREVEIRLEGNKIVVSRYFPLCIFCGESQNLIEFENAKICTSCAEKIGNSAK